MKIRNLFIPENRTIKQQIAVCLGLLIIMAGSGSAGGLAGFYAGTGELPTFLTGKPEVILPPAVSETTTEQVATFLAEDKSDLIDYQEGFNCVEAALLAARNAHWEGIDAEVFALVGEDGSLHMIIGFPTEDGWVFVDSLDDKIIEPRPGKFYNGVRVIRIDHLEVKWVPFME